MYILNRAFIDPTFIFCLLRKAVTKAAELAPLQSRSTLEINPLMDGDMQPGPDGGDVVIYEYPIYIHFLLSINRGYEGNPPSLW